MIEVIKHGSKRTATCQDCGCVMTFAPEDVAKSWKGMNEPEGNITCPECGHRVIVPIERDRHTTTRAQSWIR